MKVQFLFWEDCPSHSEAWNRLRDVLRDESQEVARAYGAERTPHVYLLDSGGILRYRGAIDDNYEQPEAVRHPYLRDALDAVLAGDSPAVETTPAVGCTIKWRA